MAKENLARVDTVVHHLAAPVTAVTGKVAKATPIHHGVVLAPAMGKEKDTRVHPLIVGVTERVVIRQARLV